jgi:hypothetical protein
MLPPLAGPGPPIRSAAAPRFFGRNPNVMLSPAFIQAQFRAATALIDR